MISEKYIDQLLRFARYHALFTKEENVLLAISGGVDSVAMGRMFRQINQPFGVVHCNFKLRGMASDDDEAFVKKLAEEWEAPFYSRSFETKAYADREGLSIQMAARNLRYEFFEKLMAGSQYQKLATAHHIDDAFETTLINIAHGTGFQGVQGIVPKRGRFIRPMLVFCREDIMEMAKLGKIEWREDASNEKDDYERNKIRHHIYPVLRQLNPSFSSTLKDTMERLWAAGRVMESAVDKWAEEFMQKEDGVEVIRLYDRSPGSNLLLFEALKRHTNINYKVFKQLEQAIGSGVSGKLFYTASHVLNLDRDKIFVSLREEAGLLGPVQIREDDEAVSLPIGVLLASNFEMPVEIEKRETVALLDRDKLTFPLHVRLWQQGDTFIPLGMKGQKKLSDFMIDCKIPVNLKQRVLVLVSGGQIAWVVGRRIDERFKISSSTKNVLRLELC